VELGDGATPEELRRYVDWTIRNLATMAPILDDPETLDYAVGRGLGDVVFEPLSGEGGFLLDPFSLPADDTEFQGLLQDLIDDAPGNLLVLEGSATIASILDEEALAAYLHFVGAAAQQALPSTDVMLAVDALDPDAVAALSMAIQSAPTSLGLAFHPDSGRDFVAEMASHFIDRPVALLPDAIRGSAVATPLYEPFVAADIVNDLDSMRFMNSGRFQTHLTFVGAQEWGAWHNHYCALRAPAFERYRFEQCLDDISAPLGDAANGVKVALTDLVEIQSALDGSFDVTTWLHTSPPPPYVPSLGQPFWFDAVHDWGLAEVETFESAVAPRLQRFADDVDDVLYSLAVVSPLVPPHVQHLYGEIFDSVQITGLRARHARHIWSAVAGFQKSRVFFEPDPPDDLAEHIAAAREITIARKLVVAQRELRYRYPVERATGAEQYLETLHTSADHAFLEREAEQHIEARFQGITIPDVVLQDGESLQIEVADPVVGDVTVYFGDGRESTARTFDHSYEFPGRYKLRILEDREPWKVQHVTWVARVGPELATGFSGNVLDPAAANVVNMVLPSLVIAPMEPDQLVLGIDVDESGRVLPHNFVVADTAPDSNPLETLPSRLVLAGVNHMFNYIFTSLVLTDMVLRMDPSNNRFEITGQLRTFTAIRVIMDYAGFDEAGATELLAGVLGYDPDALPEQLPFLVEYLRQ